MWALSIAPPFSMPVVAGAGGYFAPHIRAYIRRSGAPAAHRRAGRGQGPAQRRPQPVRPPAAGRHHAGDGAGLPDAVGPGPVRRDVPVLGRRVRGGHRRLGRRGRRPPGPVAWIRATAMRTEPTMFAGKDHVNPRAAGRECAAALWRQAGITDPLNEIDVAEIYVPFSWFEPMWLENLGFAAAGRGLAADRGGRDRHRRQAAGQPVRRRAQLQPDRRFRAAAIRRVGAAGHGQGRRAPGSRGPRSPWATPTAAAPSSSPCGWSRGHARLTARADAGAREGLAAGLRVSTSGPVRS